MNATINMAEAEEILAGSGAMLADVYAAIAAYVAERDIDTDVSIDTPLFTAVDVAVIAARLSR